MDERLLHVCHGCDKRGEDGQSRCRGRCVCSVDWVPIIEHATSGRCPLNLYQMDAQRPQVVTVQQDQRREIVEQTSSQTTSKSKGCGCSRARGWPNGQVEGLIGLGGMVPHSGHRSGVARRS